MASPDPFLGEKREGLFWLTVVFASDAGYFDGDDSRDGQAVIQVTTA